jgi:hypothetical protein
MTHLLKVSQLELKHGRFYLYKMRRWSGENEKFPLQGLNDHQDIDMIAITKI